jgi:hypothetical protein
MGKSDLRSICPLDCLGGPVIFVVIDIRPLRFRAYSAIFLNTRSHVNAVLLFQLFVRQMLRWGRLDSYADIKVS